MRRSSRGNPYHDERGRFTHAPVGKSPEIIKNNYDERTVERFSKALTEMEPDEEFGRMVGVLHEAMRSNPEYDKACTERERLAEEYNELAVDLAEKSKEYNLMVNSGKPFDAGNIVEESDRARERFEAYKRHHLETRERFEGNLVEIKKHASGGDPFYRHKYHISNTPTIRATTLPYEPGRKAGFKDTVTDYDGVEFNRAINEVSALRDEPREKTVERFNELMVGRERNYENVSGAIKTLYTEKPISDREHNFITLDIETNSLSPAEGNIIEFGAVEISPFGEEVGRYEQLYDVSEAQLEVNGVGAEHVHHISHDMIKGKKQFREDTQNVLEYMKRGTVVVHNKDFELNWFRQQIPGFTEAEQRGEIRVVDTMHICRKFCPTERNTLQSFVEYNGGTYENAHRSVDDALMTIRALFAWLEAN